MPSAPVDVARAESPFVQTRDKVIQRVSELGEDQQLLARVSKELLLFENLEPGVLAGEVRAEPHLLVIKGEVGDAPPQLEQQLTRVAVALVLLHGIGDGLLGQVVLPAVGELRCLLSCRLRCVRSSPPTAAKQAQWAAFSRRVDISPAVSLESVTGVLRRFLLPPASAVTRREPFEQEWPAGGDWWSG